MPFSNVLDRLMIRDLTNEANKIAEKAKRNASWSKSIPDAIGVGKAQKSSNGNFEIDITVDLKVAPHAAAFEYGSGERGERGEKYIIEPSEKEALAFAWTPDKIPWGSPKFIGLGTDDKFLFRYVEHPGVEAKPYLQPAIEETRQGFVNALRQTIRNAYRESTVRVEVISAEK